MFYCAVVHLVLERQTLVDNIEVLSDEVRQTTLMLTAKGRLMTLVSACEREFRDFARCTYVVFGGGDEGEVCAMTRARTWRARECVPQSPTLLY